MQAEEDRVRSVIIGTGINVNQEADDFPEELKETATSLSLAAGEKIDRASVMQHILLSFEKRYRDYLAHGFTPIKLLWESYALGIGSELRARTLNGTFYGKALGIDEEGVLLLETKEGIKKSIRQISKWVHCSWYKPVDFDILPLGSIACELHLFIKNR